MSRVKLYFPILVALVLLATVAAQCGAPATVIVTKVVEKEVVVTKEVVVEKEVIVTKEVEKQVVVTATPLPPVPKERTVLRYGAGGDFDTLDAQRVQGGGLPNAEWVFGRLTWYDPTMMDPVPQVAESWTVSEDGLTFVFNLRQGVKFHNGREVTAEDVVFSWDRVFEIGDKGRGALELADVESYEATGEYEFTVKLERPSPVFVSSMAHWALAIVPKEHADELDTQPISCGPYKFVEWLPNDHAKYVKFDDFWDKEMLSRLPDEIVLLPITEEQTRLAMLKTGDIDIAEYVSARNWEEIENTPGLNLLRQEVTASYYTVAFGLEQEPTKDKKLRQALTWAFDREAIQQSAFFGAGEIDCSFIPRGHWAYSPLTCPTYKPEMARQLLEEAGYGEGLKLTIRPYTWHDEEIQVAQIIQQNLQDIGIEADIEVLELATYDEVVWYDHDFQISQAWYTREPDPDGLMQSVFREGGGNNFMGYSNSRIEELFDEGKSTLDRSERKRIYKEIQEILLEDVPLAKIMSVELAHAANDKVQGLHVAPKGPIVQLWYEMTFEP